MSYEVAPEEFEIANQIRAWYGLPPYKDEEEYKEKMEQYDKDREKL